MNVEAPKVCTPGGAFFMRFDVRITVRSEFYLSFAVCHYDLPDFDNVALGEKSPPWHAKARLWNQLSLQQIRELPSLKAQLTGGFAGPNHRLRRHCLLLLKFIVEQTQISTPQKGKTETYRPNWWKRLWLRRSIARTESFDFRRAHREMRRGSSVSRCPRRVFWAFRVRGLRLVCG